MTTTAPKRTSGLVLGQPLPAWLSIPEIADLCGKHRHSVRRLLQSGGVRMGRAGRKVVVATSDLRDAMPELVRSIEDRRMQTTVSDSDGLQALSAVSAVSDHTGT